MRTFGIIVATLLACLVVGFAGWWVGSGALTRHDIVMANITDRGDLEITSLQPRTLEVYGVTFNDRDETEACSSRPNPVFWARDWRMNGPDGTPGRWYLRYTSVKLGEGDVVYALYNPQACGERIVKAEVSTSRGLLVFRYPRVERAFVGGPRRTTLTLDRSFELR